MKRGDLVQIRSGLWGAGDIGVVVGPAGDAHEASGYLDVLFHDGLFATHPSSLKLVRGGKVCKRRTAMV